MHDFTDTVVFFRGASADELDPESFLDTSHHVLWTGAFCYLDQNCTHHQEGIFSSAFGERSGPKRTAK